MDAWNSSYKSHQGNLGLGAAIAYYTSQCIPVSIPLNDTQGYDLVIDDETLKRVQVKTTKSQTKFGDYVVQLKNTVGSSGKSVIRLFNNLSCDILFVVTRSGDKYQIPALEIKSKATITLNSNYDSIKFLTHWYYKIWRVNYRGDSPVC